MPRSSANATPLAKTVSSKPYSVAFSRIILSFPLLDSPLGSVIGSEYQSPTADIGTVCARTGSAVLRESGSSIVWH